jgi:uncharacterized membrane-anchored protein
MVVTAAAAPPTHKPAGQSASTKANGSAGSGSSGSAAPAGSGSADSATDDSQGSGSDSADMPAHLVGPKTVDLGNKITVDLPEATVLFEAAVAKKMIEAGGGDGEHVVAAIVKPPGKWALIIEYSDVGYVDDSDADKLDADDLLDTYKQGNTEQNEKRKQLGVPELFLDGWSELPRYEHPTHHLLWGLKAHDSDGPVINYFTRVLGRNGYLSINLIDKPDNIEKAKAEAAPIIAAIKFGAGARYEDHASSDKDSGIGLKTLILGGAGIAVVSKAGFFLKLLLIFKKGIIFLVAGIAGFFRWITGRRKKPEPGRNPPMPPSPSDGPPFGGPPEPPRNV